MTGNSFDFSRQKRGFTVAVKERWKERGQFTQRNGRFQFCPESVHPVFPFKWSASFMCHFSYLLARLAPSAFSSRTRQSRSYSYTSIANKWIKEEFPVKSRPWAVADKERKSFWRTPKVVEGLYLFICLSADGEKNSAHSGGTCILCLVSRSFTFFSLTLFVLPFWLYLFPAGWLAGLLRGDGTKFFPFSQFH